MKQFLITLAAVICAMVIVVIGLPVMLIAMAISSSGPKIAPGPVVLSLDLRQSLNDQSQSNYFDFLTGQNLSTMRIVSTLDQASKDSTVKSIIIRLPEGGMAPAAAEEIRTALTKFQSSGKTVYAHSQGLYPTTMVVATYMVGASANEFWMQPNASFQVTGISISETFLKRAFDKYDIKASFEQRYEYKNAVNGYTQTDFTPAHREATLSWMGSIYDNMITASAVSRKQKPETLKASLESGPFGAEQAKNLGLITHVGGLSALETKAKESAKTESIVDFEDYADKKSSGVSGKGSDTIAVINGEGPIMTGYSDSDPFGSDPLIGSDSVASAFEKATEDKNVKAIVFRVSSPGGSDTASEQIAEAVAKAKAAGKPVVISMGNYAASGGYWVSTGADSIVANPSTLTGSIGVYGGKIAIGPAAARYGIDFKDIGVGSDYAGAYSPAGDFTPKQRASISGWIDTIYDSFIKRVATGRKLPENRVREIAKGRVWTGQQALDLKLVDKVGGFDIAVSEAKRLAKIEKDNVSVRVYQSGNGKKGGFGSSLKSFMQAIEALNVMGLFMDSPEAKLVIKRAQHEKLQSDGANVMASDPLLIAQ
jgi:protease-4